MKKIISFLLILIFLPIYAKAQSLSKIYEYQLSNGLKLIVKEDRSSYAVVVHTAYNVGSIYESMGVTGISHALEHMMFLGTKEYGPGVLDRVFYKKGVIANAATSNDYTFYYEITLPENLPTIFELEADRMQNLLLNEELFAKEKQVIIEERKSRVDDNPSSSALEQFLGIAFISNPYRNPIIGWMHDIENLDIDDLRVWYRDYYVPNNAVIVVIGNVDHLKVHKLADTYFGDIPQGKLPRYKFQNEVEHYGLREIVIRKDIQSPQLLMAYNVPTLNNVDEKWKAYALLVLAHLLSGGDSSSLQRDLVRKDKMAIQVSAGYNMFLKLDSLFKFVAMPANGRSLKDLKNAMLQQIELLKDGLVSKDELEVAKIRLASEHVYAQDYPDSQAKFIARLALMGLPCQLAEDYLDGLELVAPEQIREVAREFFIEKRLSIAKILPIETDYNNKKDNGLDPKKKRSSFPPNHDEL